MKKNTTRWWVILGAVLVVYNVIVFVVPFPKNPVFFLSWLFTLAAIGAQGYVVRTAFYRGEGVRSKFYGWPIAKIGLAYLAVQLALGLAFMALGLAVSVPVWLPLVLYVVLLGVSAAGFVAADAVRDEVVRQDVKLVKDTSFMHSLQAKAASLPGLTQDAQLARLLEQFAEELRYSDPVSGEALRDAEAELAARTGELQRAVADGDKEAALALERKARAALSERNRLCKLNKGAAH